jgi:sugar (pentulose or hexulose) kinase
MSAAVTSVVIDIGKTLSKVTAWSWDGAMLARHVRPNAQRTERGVSRLDVHGIADWLRETLALFAGEPVETIIPVAHGAGVVALNPAGTELELAITPFDYEQELPAATRAAYERERDPFAETGSPLLPCGLNMGAQLHWMAELYPEAMASARLVPWAQYWAWYLAGVAVTEVTSLGCHSDLWRPAEGDFSRLAYRRGWAAQFAPIARAGAVIGTLDSRLADATGLPATARVLAGLHDSNAALLAARGFREIADNEATVLSTGTWFVAMRLAREAVPASQLDENRDTLVNVDAYGSPVPSARFMGGREIESVIEIDTRRVDIRPDQPRLLASVSGLLARGTMMMPTLAPGFGPFPGHAARWVDAPAAWTGTWYARRAAMCLYAALVADASLDLVGARERLLVEGRFAEAEVFVRALAALRPDTQVFVANEHNDVSFGALRLADPALEAPGDLRRIAPLEGDLAGYRERWRRHLARTPA